MSREHCDGYFVGILLSEGGDCDGLGPFAEEARRCRRVRTVSDLVRGKGTWCRARFRTSMEGAWVSCSV